MSSSVAHDSRDLALELHTLLRQLDPARGSKAEIGAHRWDEIGKKASRLAEYQTPAGPSLREIVSLLQRHSAAEARSELQIAYESLASSLQAADLHVPALRPTNWMRSVFHVGSALLAILLVEYVLDPQTMMLVACLFAMLGWAMEASRHVSERSNEFMMWLFRPVAHPHERHRVNSATWYVSALAVLSVMGSEPVAVVGLAILGLADPAAAAVGRRWGRVCIANGRTLEGTLGFVVVGFAAALGVLWVWHPEIAWPLSGVVAGGAAIAGALAELWVRRVDDNFAIPVASGAAALATLALFA